MNKIKWSVIIEEKREEIEDKCREAYKNSICKNSQLQGWHYGVEIDENSVWTFGPTSQGSQSMSSVKGESCVVAIFGCASIYGIIDIARNARLLVENRYIADLPANWNTIDGNSLSNWEKEEWIEGEHPEILEESIEDCLDWLVDEYDPSFTVDEVIADCKKWEQEESCR